MLKSMTGYGRGETLGNGRSYLVEVRSVNNRYLDCSVRIPRIYTCAEDGITQRVKRTITRGKVDVFVTIETTTAEAVSVTLNEAVAAGYLRALETMSAKFGLNDAVSTELLSRFPDVFRVEKVPEDLDELTKEVHRAADLALADFDAMRSREGQKLMDDLSGRLDTLEQYTLQVEARGPERVAEYRAMLAGGSPIGRKLAFLVQEMNRETNTIGSKANDLEMSTLVVDMKAELEKIREQIQNVE